MATNLPVYKGMETLIHTGNSEFETMQAKARPLGLDVIIRDDCKSFSVIDWGGQVLWEKFSDEEFFEAFIAGYEQGMRLPQV